MIRVRGNPALHVLDRYAGIPAVALLGSMRRKHLLPSPINTIGLLKGGAIGDTVLLTGVIADLREAFPNAKLILFAGESNYEMACMLEGLDRVVKAPAGNLAKAIRAMRSVPVDVMIDFGQWSRLEALYAIASHSAFKIGFRTFKQHRHAGYDQTVEHSACRHELENYRELIRVLGVKTAHLPFLRPIACSTPQVADKAYVVCHLWPGGRRRELKQWPVERWIKLIGELNSWGLQIVLTGGPEDEVENENVISGLREELRPFVKNAAGLHLDQTVSVVAESVLVVSVNTGVMHIAAALGLPVVSLQGPTSSKRWGPIGEKSIAVDSTLDGCGYLDLGWEYPTEPPACMAGVSYETVRDACRALLQKQGNALPSIHVGEPVVLEKSAAS